MTRSAPPLPNTTSDDNVTVGPAGHVRQAAMAYVSEYEPAVHVAQANWPTADAVPGAQAVMRLFPVHLYPAGHAMQLLSMSR